MNGKIALACMPLIFVAFLPGLGPTSGNCQGVGGSWRFNEGSGTVAYDDLGVANNGTFQNMDASAWRFDSPPEGSAYLHFDGTNDYINVADQAELDLTTELTLEAYIRANNADVTSQAVIIVKSASTVRYRLAVTGTHKVKLSVRISNTLYSLEGKTDVIDGTWHHIAGTFDQTNGLRVWVDRRLDGGPEPLSGTVETDNGALRIGAQSASEDQFRGDIDHPQVLNYFDSSLPVTLASFQAAVVAGGVQLNWVTESEVNNRGFYVLRSEGEAAPYRIISSLIPGAGSSVVPHSYQYVDRTVAPEQSYWYKLRQEDFGGQVELFGPVVVYVPAVSDRQPSTVPTRTALVGGYPNPFNPGTAVQFALAAEQEVELGVFDLRGRLVRALVQGVARAGEHEARWDGRDEGGAEAPAGVYVCRLRCADGFHASVKLIKLR
ncbi:MAG: T9SS type A sorting domain-containing protein [Calditrichaeota bacterium]|nr:T9SS type A sorting domain-containing protein [Calditrichota bacterium]